MKEIEGMEQVRQNSYQWLVDLAPDNLCVTTAKYNALPKCSVTELIRLRAQIWPYITGSTSITQRSVLRTRLGIPTEFSWGGHALTRIYHCCAYFHAKPQPGLLDIFAVINHTVAFIF